MWADAALVLGAYLLGSAPHLTILARLRGVRLRGDFHEGLYSRAGRTMGVIGVLGEFTKGAAPVLAGRALDFNTVTVALAGLAAVVGQMWPVFSRFDGEKGNSIGIAMAAALAPWAVLFAIVLRITRRLRVGGSAIGGPYSRVLPLGMLTGFLVFPLAAWGLGEPPAVVWCGMALWVFIVVRRLTAGLDRDLKVSGDTRGVLLRRFFYDRSTEAWRR
jgi:glycerol-3-phosphate acyltransferase PlsY